MKLWRMDVVDGLPLVDGTEARIPSGVDNHLRFRIYNTVLARATAGSAGEFFADALSRHQILE
jgi:hypothetical protein